MYGSQLFEVELCYIECSHVNAVQSHVNFKNESNIKLNVHGCKVYGLQICELPMINFTKTTKPSKKLVNRFYLLTKILTNQFQLRISTQSINAINNTSFVITQSSINSFNPKLSVSCIINPEPHHYFSRK